MDKGVYFTSQQSEGYTCEFTLKDRNVYIYKIDKTVIIWRLDSTVNCTFDGVKVRITKNNKSASFECNGDMAHTIYQTWNSPDVPKHQERRPFVSYAPFIIFCSTLLTIGLLIYFIIIPWLGIKFINYIPERVEVELGDALSKQYSLQYKTNDSANYYANKFCATLKFNTSYPIRIEILDSEELNAFALPGGRIFVYKGLLTKLNSYEELAALLGHEASHIIKRHSLKSILRSAATGITISSFLGDYSALSTWAVSKADEFKQLDYSRELETEADDEGYALMLKSHINPNGMLRLLEVLKKESMELPTMMKYLSTHPETEERIKNIKKKSGLQSTYLEQENLKLIFLKLKASTNK
jgi:Zn-dependent protease with chaperone function